MRGAAGAEGVESGEGFPPPQLEWGLGRGCTRTPLQERFVQFTFNSLILRHFLGIRQLEIDEIY